MSIHTKLWGFSISNQTDDGQVAFETKDFYCSKRTNIKVQLCYSTTGSVPLPATNSGNTESIAEYLDIWTGPESRVERGTQNTVLVVHG